MFISKLFTILLATMMLMKFRCIQTSSTVEKLERRYRRYTNSENCGILPTAHVQHIRANKSVEDSLQKEDGIVNKDQVLQSKILGGETSKSKWPWMAGLLFEGKHICGGTVIDDRHVLTAAHCFDTRHPRQFSVQVGELSHGDPRSHYKIEYVKMHNYQKHTSVPKGYNDIAILRLDSPLPSDIIPACLPTEDSLKDGDYLTILGWGFTEADGTEPSNNLKETHDLQYMPNAQCQEIIPSIIDSQFCLRYQGADKGDCKGDSGGPVMYKNQRGQFELVGIVSFGFECGLPNIPGVYTKVFHYLQWIQQAIREGEQDYSELFGKWRKR